MERYFRAFGPGGTVVIELDKDLLHGARTFLKNYDLTPLDIRNSGGG
jgi:hypothetical protein